MSNYGGPCYELVRDELPETGTPVGPWPGAPAQVLTEITEDWRA